MQQLLDNPGVAAALVSILGALATLIGAVAVYVQVKTEQARQGERMVGLQRQINQLPAQPAAPVYLPAPAAPQPQAPPVATTVLTLPAEGTALHIEAVPRSTPVPAPAPEPSDAAVAEPPLGHAPDWRP